MALHFELVTPSKLVRSEDVHMVVVPGAEDLRVDLTAVRGDDWFFGVNACSAQGACSPVASAVPAGHFAPLAAEEDDSD